MRGIRDKLSSPSPRCVAYAPLLLWLTTPLAMLLLAGCPGVVALDDELLLYNNSERWYLALELEVPGLPPFPAPVLPPGAALRMPFSKITDGACPTKMLVRAYLFEADATQGDSCDLRLRSGAIISEECEDSGDLCLRSPAMASIQVQVEPCILVRSSPIYVITLRNSPRGKGILLLDPDIRIDFWGRTVESKDADSLLRRIADEEIAGQVLDRCGVGMPEVGVMLQPLYRDATPCPPKPGENVRIDCEISHPISQLGLPVDATTTNEEGRFTFCQPPGFYAVVPFGREPLGEALRFGPTRVLIEAPARHIVILAEPDSEEAGEEVSTPCSE
ncbi:MAG: hypothetical protein JSU86_18550 [Phycisphaerales bacterium]|nr:MAG: hypothetical protein JSU86_18550 [Phycisphaerales bacterium]